MGNTLKICSVRTEVVYVPRLRAYNKVALTALGPANFSEYGLVFIDTDEGITGIGEISTVFFPNGRLLCELVDETLSSIIVGEDPFRISYLMGKLDQAIAGAEPAKAGIDMALWDIVGKALNVPVYQLFGGMTRDRIPLSYSVPFGEPEEMAEFAREKSAQGFRTIKVKVGQGVEQDVAAVRLVREAVGYDRRVRVDANMAWRSPKAAISIIRAMEPYRPELIEQPLPRRELDGLAEIRRQVSVPIMADESVWNPRDAMEVIRRGAADVINVYVAESGGIQNAAKIFAMCDQANVQTMIGSMPELGVGTAAQIHLGIAMNNLCLDSDTCGVLYHAEDVLLTPLRFKNGYAFPPDGPGLGVEVDKAVVERLLQPPLHS